MIKKMLLLIIIYTIVLLRIFFINGVYSEKYKELLDRKINNYVSSLTPRGRILDRNGKVLVDNEGIRTIFYQKDKNVTLEEELKIASLLSEIIDVEPDEYSSKRYWLIKNDNGENLITLKEKEKLKNRKITNEDIKKMKFARVSDEQLKKLSDKEHEIAAIYNLMNKGYSYERKIIKEGIDDETYGKLIENNIKGISVDLTWKRIYNYGDTLKDIFGKVGKIPEENKDYYLEKGYDLNDVVGLSYLEYMYDDYLKGNKDFYKIDNKNETSLIKSGNVGSDLILSIDIDVQLKLEELLKENILNAKKRKNTDYFEEMYSIVGDPNTGEIIALSGQKLIDYNNKKFKNTNINLITSSFTVGSVVKLATLSVGYKNKVIDIGTKFKDSCIKLYQVPRKCSYKNLGSVSDLTAISKSSNYYQFKIAIGITGQKYKNNMILNTTKKDFNKFRDMFAEYGLGSLTGIDLPNEKIGIIGKNTSSDLLLNLSIGQYDTYTPMQLFQYVNTVASKGQKRKPQLMKKIIDNGVVIEENNYNIVSEVPMDEDYKNRLVEAMNLATTSGTARNYIEKKYKPAGKTGTSETFVDKNNDGIMETKTTSIAFIGFAPYDKPKYSIVVLAPNIYVDKGYSYKKLYITRYISKDIMNFMFEK